MCGFGRADFVVGPEFGVGAREDDGGFFGEVNTPFFGEHAEDSERAACAEPTFCYLFEVLDAVDDVSPSVLLREAQEVDGACRVCNIHDNVTYLS